MSTLTSRQRAAACSIIGGLVTSSRTSVRLLASPARSGVRDAAYTCLAPRARSCSTIALPMPLLAPVTSATMSRISMSSPCLSTREAATELAQEAQRAPNADAPQQKRREDAPVAVEDGQPGLRIRVHMQVRFAGKAALDGDRLVSDHDGQLAAFRPAK